MLPHARFDRQKSSVIRQVKPTKHNDNSRIAGNASFGAYLSICSLNHIMVQDGHASRELKDVHIE